jgi:formylglycine-generating enzyme required for sulfatase activity
MRFIDMFMTALGSLVFIAMLLVFLLPNTTQQESSSPKPTIQPPAPPIEMVPKEQLIAAMIEIEKLKEQLKAAMTEIKKLKEQLEVVTAQAAFNKTEERDIVKRWFGVVLRTSGCTFGEPVLYVRYEGELVDFATEKPTGPPLEFDASDPTRMTHLVGYKYFNLDQDPQSASAIHGWSRLFYGVSRGVPASYSVYVGLQNPRAFAGKDCVIYPVFTSATDQVVGERISLRERQPFAWLGRLRFDNDSKVSFLDNAPGFVDELLAFSKKQSKILCEKKSVCDTVDAHYAQLTRLTRSRPGAYPLSPEKERALKPKDTFKECDACPEMTVAPAGSFTMGSPDGEKDRSSDEGPQRGVRFAKEFAVGRFAVTFEEWDACVADGGCKGYKPSDGGWGRGRRPVINVSWEDAKAYTEWLSARTGKEYRLLSEAEREYVTRAGTTTPFWWGSAASTSRANYDGNFAYDNEQQGRPRRGGRAPGEYRERTVPVDAFAPNPWGLHQVHGNVWEWDEDCWDNKSREKPSDGSSLVVANCDQHVRRGGSWRNNPQFLRAAVRGPSITSARTNNIGFRVARTLNR